MTRPPGTKAKREILRERWGPVSAIDGHVMMILVTWWWSYSNLPLDYSLIQSLYSSPRPYPPPPPPPPFGSNPSSLPLLPYALDSLLSASPLHPGPGLLDPSSDTPCQPHFQFGSPSTLVPSFTVSPVPLPSVIHPPDQCRPWTPYPLRILHSPCPQLTPTHPPT